MANVAHVGAGRRCQTQPPGASGFRTGDLVFVQPQLDTRHSPLDAAILPRALQPFGGCEPRATVPGNETATHVAMARGTPALVASALSKRFHPG